MADREYVITFDGDRARVALAAGDTKLLGNYTVDGLYLGDHRTEYHVRAPSAARAEQIARAMRGERSDV